MRVAVYFAGVFFSLLAGFALAGLSGSVGVGLVASVAVFLITVYLAWEWRAHGDEEKRAHAQNAGVYSQVGHGGGLWRRLRWRRRRWKLLIRR